MPFPASPALSGTGVTATPVAPVTKEALKRLPKDVRGAVKNRKVFVMLFYNNRSYDDRAVRRELSKVDRFGGQVFVDAHWIKSVGRYQAITGGIDVDQSPTVVVADRNLKADTLVGYVDHQTIDQLVVDALRASGGSLIKQRYFRKLDLMCSGAQAKIAALPQPTSTATIPPYLEGVNNIAIEMFNTTRVMKPPSRYKKFHKNFTRYTQGTTYLTTFAAVDAKNAPKDGPKIVKGVVSDGKKLDAKFVDKNGAHGLSCF